MNQVSLIGRLGRDPELRVTPGGVSVARFSLAVSRVDARKGVDWFDITCFGKVAEAVSQHLKKGSQVGVAGRLQQEKWTAQDGQQRSKVSVLAGQVDFLGRPREQDGDIREPEPFTDDEIF